MSLFMLTDTTAAATDKIRCDACPVMCYIKPGAAGACDRYANHYGELVRVDPHIVLERTVSHGGRLVPIDRRRGLAFAGRNACRRAEEIRREWAACGIAPGNGKCDICLISV
jgi:hypothetical protein